VETLGALREDYRNKISNNNKRGIRIGGKERREKKQAGKKLVGLGG